MKKILAWAVIAALLLSGCGQLVPARSTHPTETTAPAATTTPESTQPQVEETEAPTEPPKVYFNPLNGKILDEPYTGRVMALSINNLAHALPHYGTNKADIVMEMWVNGSIIRDLALFTDTSELSQIGSIRSDRMMFNQILSHYDAILFDAGGDQRVLAQAREWGLDRFNIYADTNAPTYYSYRDLSREFMFKVSDKYEHCLFADGRALTELAQNQGFRTTQDPEKDYFLRFVDEGTPADGETANQITVTFTYKGSKKATTMVYNPELDKYVYNQYEKEMVDGTTGEPEAFNNVIVMLADITTQVVFHVADFEAGGTGYFACGGKLVPITWKAEEGSPFQFFTADGQPLNLNRGNTYIAIAPNGSPVEYS